MVGYLQQVWTDFLEHGFSFLLLRLIADGVFLSRLIPKKNFLPRAAVASAIYFLVGAFLNPLAVRVEVSLPWFISFLLLLFLPFLCFDNKLTDFLFCDICAITLVNVIGLLSESLVLIVLGGGTVSEVPKYVLFLFDYILAAMALVPSYFFLAKRIDKDGPIVLNNYWVYPIAILVLFMVTGYLNKLPNDTYVEELMAKAFRIGLNLLVLILMFSFVQNKKLVEEQKMLEMMIERDNERFRQMREYMEVIDIKCHDFKKMLDCQQFGEGVNREIVSELEQSVEEYRNTPKTGNAALDVVLYDKIIVCKEKGILLTYIVDAEPLKKLHSSDIANIFNNLLYNGIEYLETLSEEENRLFSLNVSRRNDFLYISAENYCAENMVFVNGLPRTKKGKNHGFGLKSVAYTVNRYGGTLRVGQRDNCFYVHILIPLNGSEKESRPQK